MTPMINPLVWGKVTGRFWRASADFDYYYIARTNDGFGYGFANEEYGHIGFDADVMPHQSAFDAATAAAEADYAARITAAIDPAWLARMEALVMAADGLADAVEEDGWIAREQPHIDTALTTYRAAKEAANG